MIKVNVIKFVLHSMLLWKHTGRAMFYGILLHATPGFYCVDLYQDYRRNRYNNLHAMWGRLSSYRAPWLPSWCHAVFFHPACPCKLMRGGREKVKIKNLEPCGGQDNGWTVTMVVTVLGWSARLFLIGWLVCMPRGNKCQEITVLRTECWLASWLAIVQDLDRQSVLDRFQFFWG